MQIKITAETAAATALRLEELGQTLAEFRAIGRDTLAATLGDFLADYLTGTNLPIVEAR